VSVTPGTNIPYRAHSIEEVVDTLDRSIEEVEQTLFEGPHRRIKPGLDNKGVLAWNGKMRSLYARASSVIGDTHYRKMAVQSAEFLLDHVYDPKTNRLERVYRNGETMQERTLEK
jgi:uncharacterized protein YyaL (SSP411 family)